MKRLLVCLTAVVAAGCTRVTTLTTLHADGSFHEKTAFKVTSSPFTAGMSAGAPSDPFASAFKIDRAAQDAGKFAIGVDSDQDYLAPGAVLTSMVKHVDDAVYRTIKDVKDNTFTPGVMRFDLKSKGVGLTKFQYTKDKIGDANIKKIDEISQEIADGKIGVPSTADELTSYLASLKTGTAKKA